MLFKPLIGDQMSGSMGGVTASHNRGGTYFRQRAIPVNPNTPQQQAIRSIMGQLTSLWFTLLSEAQRTGWDTYADNVPLTNRIGDPHNVGGLGMYVRSNVARLQAALTRIDDAPAIFNLGDYTAPTIASVTAPTALSLGFTATDDWVGEDGAAMLVYGSVGQNGSVNYFKGPYRFADLIAGNLALPPTSPAAIVLPFALTAAQREFIRVVVVRADGRVSEDFRDFSVVS